jgi:prolyl-tRNA synthetase
VPVSDLGEQISTILDEIQKGYYEQAKQYRDENIRTDIDNLEDLKAFFTPKNEDKPEIHGGFIRAKWCEDPESEKLLDGLKVSIRCLPLDQSGTEGRCILTGKPAKTDAIFAKSY